METYQYNNDSYKFLNQSLGQIKIIRHNPWPLILKNDFQGNNEKVLEWENQFGVPKEIITEAIILVQAVGYIPGIDFNISEESYTYYGSEEEARSSFADIRVEDTIDEEDFIRAFEDFLSQLSKLQIIQSFQRCENKEEIKDGLFRISSLYDTNFSRFKKIEDFLNFLLINIQIQDEFFGSDYLPLLKESSGLPIDDVEGKERFRFSKDKYISELGTLKFEQQEIGVHFRIIPGFNPTGLWFSIGLNLEDKDGMETNNNSLYLWGIYFEKNGEDIVPVVHTIQNSPHNIGINSNNNIVYFDEGDSENYTDIGMNSLGIDKNGNNELEEQKKNIRLSLANQLKDFVGVQSIETEFLALILDKIFAYGFKKVRIIDGKENLWLSRHNTQRNETSIEASYETMYGSKAKELNGRYSPNEGYLIDYAGIVRYLGKYPEIEKRYLDLCNPLLKICKNLDFLQVNYNNEKKKNNVNNLARESLKLIDGIIEKLEKVLVRERNVDGFLDVYNSTVRKEKRIKDFYEGLDSQDSVQERLFIEGVESLHTVGTTPEFPAEIRNLMYNLIDNITIEKLPEDLIPIVKELKTKVFFLLGIN